MPYRLVVVESDEERSAYEVGAQVRWVKELRNGVFFQQ